MSTVDKLIIGVAAGAILGILYAPDKGSETRKKLSRTGIDLRDRLNRFRDTVNEKIDSYRDEATDIAYEEMAKMEKEPASPAWQ